MVHFVVVFDSCVLYSADLAPAKVIATVRETRLNLKSPPKTTVEYLSILEQQSLPRTVAYLKEFEKMI